MDLVTPLSIYNCNTKIPCILILLVRQTTDTFDIRSANSAPSCLFLHSWSTLLHIQPTSLDGVQRSAEQRPIVKLIVYKLHYISITFSCLNLSVYFVNFDLQISLTLKTHIFSSASSRSLSKWRLQQCSRQTHEKS